MEPLWKKLWIWLKSLSALKGKRNKRKIRHHRYFELNNLTFLAVVSFKPIRTLARECVVSSYCAGPSILARVICARIHCNGKLASQIVRLKVLMRT